MEKVIILLAEASLETIPRELWNNSIIINDSRRMHKDPRYLILDRARHHKAMVKLPMAEKRGRPDIVHQALLLIQGSFLARNGLIKTYIHTINNVLIDIDSGIRPPRNYNNFIGLMSQLFKEGRVPPTGRALLKIIHDSVNYILNIEQPDRLVLLDDIRGKEITMREFTDYIVNFRKPLIMIGAFPRGSFEEYIYSLANDVFKIGKYTIDTASILCRLLHSLEVRLGLFA